MRRSTYASLSFVAALAFASLVACERLPVGAGAQGAVVGGVAGAVIGDEVGDGLWGSLLGGALGAAGGYLIGANVEEWFGGEPNRDEAIAAVNEAQADPATAEDVYASATADLNGDGFVTMDELLAMENAGLGDEEILNRLRATDQVYVLSPEQKDYLINAGMSPSVVYQLEEINREDRERFLSQRGAVISAPAE